MTTDVVLGAGNATGMFYRAPAGTKLPEGPFDTIPDGWTQVGDITEDGISLKMDRSTEDLKNWAGQTKRTILTEHIESVEAPIMDTTEETLKTIFGEKNVVATAANNMHGKLLNVNVSSGDLPESQAYLFLMKDGDVGAMLGCENGQIDSVGDVSFTPGAAVNWSVTIKGLGNGWKYVIDDGVKGA